MNKFIDDTGESIGNTIHEIQHKYNNNVYYINLVCNFYKIIFSPNIKSRRI